MKNDWDTEGDEREHFGEYIFFPMASNNTNSVIKNEGSEYSETFSITYDNAYGKNTINIKVIHVMRQCHANYNGGNIYYRMVESWDDIENVILDIKHPKYKDVDDSEDNDGKVIVDKNY